MKRNITIIVPYTPSIPDRAAIWEYIKPRYSGFQIIETDDPIKSNLGYNKAAAIRAAIPKINNDIIIMTDSDVWCDGLDLAIDAVKDGAPFAIPHSHIHRLSQTATTKLLTHQPISDLIIIRTQDVIKGGGLIVLQTDVMKKHPPDTRFFGWGYEDKAWFCELYTFFPNYWQGNASLYHMWHTPQVGRGKLTQSKRSNKKLYAMHTDCMGNKEAYTRLIQQIHND